jgi:hypothetical protein
LEEPVARARAQQIGQARAIGHAARVLPAGAWEESAPGLNDGLCPSSVTATRMEARERHG